LKRTHIGNQTSHRLSGTHASKFGVLCSDIGMNICYPDWRVFWLL